MAGFNDWIYFEPAATSTVEYFDEVDKVAKEDLARQIQTKLRGRIDRGTTRKEAQRAQSIQAKESDGDIVIDEKDQAEVLGEDAAPIPEPEAKEEQGIDDLFSPGTGVPSVVTGRDGSQQAAFRVIEEKDLFGGSQRALDQTVEQTVTDVVQIGMLDAFEDAAKSVELQHPEIRR
jgi:hypothetical protein